MLGTRRVRRAASLCPLLECCRDLAGGTKEKAIPERALGGPLQPQVLQDNLTLSLAEVLQVSLPLL